ncbi:hypothetical protein BGX21_003420 [Mortierella sp. AD011]|nr:hypothetical protein BGX20_008171 [Mortierella sp. AD010]KAF9400824.1 hypothetical protein BGX21_003420 [Mortierella sp. AD011]
MNTTVKVALRVRPLTLKKPINNCSKCISYVPNEPQIGIVGSDKSFKFDYVFDDEATQRHVYEQYAKGLVDRFLEGFNATILAYGQTGSGKTYNMGMPPWCQGADQALIPTAARDIFSQLGSLITEDPSMEYQVHVSFLELYNGGLIDLLQDYTHMQSRTRKEEIKVSSGISWQGVKGQQVNSAEELLYWLKQGSFRRNKAATNASPMPSRSHAIFSVNLKRRRSEDVAESQGLGCVSPENLISKLHFVDLAGPQRKTTREDGGHSNEGISINSELLALGKVISAPSDESRKPHIPYRESKLARLLRDSLGGSSSTLVLACVSSNGADIRGTTNTILYANRARNTRSKVDIDYDVEDLKSAVRSGHTVKDMEFPPDEVSRFHESPSVVSKAGHTYPRKRPARSPVSRYIPHTEQYNPLDGVNSLLLDMKMEESEPVDPNIDCSSIFSYATLKRLPVDSDSSDGSSRKRKPSRHGTFDKRNESDRKGADMSSVYTLTDQGVPVILSFFSSHSRSSITSSMTSHTNPYATSSTTSSTASSESWEMSMQSQSRALTPTTIKLPLCPSFPLPLHPDVSSYEDLISPQAAEQNAKETVASAAQAMRGIPTLMFNAQQQAVLATDIQRQTMSVTAQPRLDSSCINEPLSSAFSTPRVTITEGPCNQQQNDDTQSSSSGSQNPTTASQSMSNPCSYQLKQIPELPPSNSENPGFASQKKTRSKITIEKKISIIRYLESNPGETHANIAKEFSLSRTTVVGVIKNKDIILSHANGSSKGRYHRIVKARLLKVEAVLVKWIEHQKSHGIPISVKKVRTQAAVIHRIISGCIKGGLQDCDYTTGWFRGFKRRNGAVLEMKPTPPSQANKDFWQGQVDCYVSKQELEAIYYCYVTSMNPDVALHVIPTMVMQPELSSRQIMPDTEGESSSEFDGLANSDIERWLMDLDGRTSKSICLLVDQSAFSSITSIITAKKLRFVFPIPVPKNINSLFPMSTTLSKEFKTFFNIRHIKTRRQTHTLYEYQGLIKQAWHDTQKSSIMRSIKNSRQIVASLLKGNVLQDVQPVRDARDPATDQLQKELTERFPHQKHLEYYSAQDGDTGPSIFTCACIQEVLRNGLEQMTTTTAESPLN